MKEQRNSLILSCLYLAGSHISLLAAAIGFARILRFSRADLVAAGFVATQKTIAMGLPLLTALFSSDSKSLAVAILPLLFYHPWQLLVAGILSGAGFFRRLGQTALDIPPNHMP